MKGNVSVGVNLTMAAVVFAGHVFSAFVLMTLWL